MSKFKVYISDYDYLDLDIERSVLEPIGAEVIGLKCVTGEELGTLAADADAILQQYAKINAQHHRTAQELQGDLPLWYRCGHCRCPGSL